MRSHTFEPKNFYHIYAHGVADFPIFRQVKDYDRFLSSLFCSNGDKPIPRLDFKDDYLSLAWDVCEGKIDIGKPLVSLTSFSLVPTHIHLLLEEETTGGISAYMHKILTSHAKYFNLKYDRRGHLFESKFNSRHVDNNRYLLYVSKYIHRNSEKISKYKNSYINYPWSSCQDFVGHNRWGRFLNIDPIISQFKNQEDYCDYVKEPLRDEFPDFFNPSQA